MDYNYINNLLEKYWTGETSLEQEKELKVYFNSPSIDERLVKHQALFQFIKKEQSKGVDGNFNYKIIKAIQPTKIISVSWQKRLIAASIILLAGFFIWNFSSLDNDKKYATVKEIDDPELAYQITKEALMLVSNKLNEGASKAAEKVNKVKEINRFVKTENK